MSTLPTNLPTVQLCAVSRLARRPVTWLWPWQLGLGKLALLDGDPDQGKSMVALDLCARLSTGRPFPDGSPGPASAIVLNGEDNADDTLGPRLESLGANLDLVYVLRQEDDGPPLSFPAHVELLASAVAQAGAKLVVIDPILAYLDQGISSANDQSVRRALRPLARLAEQSGCVILLVRHLNKSGSARALYRGSGSIGIIGACRSAWLIAPDLVLPERRVLAPIKNNLAARQPSLAYELVARGTDPPVLSWLGTSPLSADQLLGRTKAGKPPWQRESACDFLSACLEDGPRTSREIWAEAQEEGLTEMTLRRAREQLKVRSARVWAGGQRLSYWLLPGQELPELPVLEDAPPSLEPWLAPLRKEFPPATPLDDL